MNLSKREIEVLQLFSLGLSASGISKKIFISCETVKSHVRNIKEKLGSKNITNSVYLASKKGLI